MEDVVVTLNDEEFKNIKETKLTCDTEETCTICRSKNV